MPECIVTKIMLLSPCLIDALRMMEYLRKCFESLSQFQFKRRKCFDLW